MMSHSLCYFLQLVFLLIGGSVASVKAQQQQQIQERRCAYDNLCDAMETLVTAVDNINSKPDEREACPGVNEKLNEQAEDLKELKENLNRNLASTAAISEQQERLSADLKRLMELPLCRAHIETSACGEKLLQSINGVELKPRDCTDIRAMGCNVSGIYRVHPGSDTRRIETDVYCDFSTTESWLVFQRRRDGSVNFERLWEDYANGFGDLNGEFWLGNEQLSLLTMNREYKLRVELEDFAGEKRYADYSTFSVGPATDNYRLTVGGYSGNAGDSLALQSGHGFSTKDVDNDANAGNCAQIYRGAWWYNSCHHSNLNGAYLGGSHTSYADGIEWHHWLGYHYSLKATAMKIMAVY